MKQIIIFLLLIIVGIMGYNFYRNYQRFKPSNYQYQVPSTISENATESALLYSYYESVEALDAHVIAQWSAEGIDVRNPAADDAETEMAVATYARKKAKVRFYEAQLLNPSEEKGPVKTLSEAEKKKQLITDMFHENPAGNSLSLGDKGALVYEIQQLLIAGGDSIEPDGLFRAETFNAIKAFEEKNGLFPDGKLDAMTLHYLLEQ